MNGWDTTWSSAGYSGYELLGVDPCDGALETWPVAKLEALAKRPKGAAPFLKTPNHFIYLRNLIKRKRIAESSEKV